MRNLRPARFLTRALALSTLLYACSHSSHSMVEVGTPDRPQNGLISIDEMALSASISGGELTLKIPVKRLSSGVVNTSLHVDLTDVKTGKALDAHQVQVKLDKATGEVSAQLKLPKPTTVQADLVNFNVHLYDGDSDGLSITRSAFAALPRYEVRLEGPSRVSVSRQVSYRVRAHDPETFKAVPNAPVTLVLTEKNGKPRTLTAKTDARGDAFFDVSLAEAGNYAVKAQAQASGTVAVLSQMMSVEAGSNRLLLTTDKPLYQPGQTVHLRALTLEKGSNKPVANSSLRFEIKDGKGNKIFKHTVKSDAYGIASDTFKLGTVLNMGTFELHAISGELDVQKTFDVSRYVLPKFAVDVTMSAPWYQANQKAEGSLDAHYFFGKDVANADVDITASTLDVGTNMFAHVMGKTNASGLFPFSVMLPDTLVGLPLDNGNALVSLHVKVTDTAGQVVEKDVALTVASAIAQLVVVPESTSIVPGIENRLHAFVSDPSGKPIAGAHVSIAGDKTVEADTDAFGQALLKVTPPEPPPSTPTDNGGVDNGGGAVGGGVAVGAPVPGGGPIGDDVGGGEDVPAGGAQTVYTATLSIDGTVVLSQPLSFAQQAGDEHVIVRTDRAVYDVGETVKVNIATTSDHGSVFVDVLHEGQDVVQRTLEAKAGAATFEIPIDTSYVGSNRVEAYVVDAVGNVIRAGATVFVREGGALSVSLATDKTQYEPGQPAKLTFSVLDEAGAPKVAALGVQIVDEAVFALVDAKPGLLRTYFELDDAFNTPHYEIAAPGGSIPELVFDDTRADDQAARNAAQERARATFAALDGMSITGLHAGSWADTLARVNTLLVPVYDAASKTLQKQLAQVAAEGKITLMTEGCNVNLGNCYDYQQRISDYVQTHFKSYDAWGRAYVQSVGWGQVTLTSAGPDELAGTKDDKSITVDVPELIDANTQTPSAGNAGGAEPPEAFPGEADDGDNAHNAAGDGDATKGDGDGDSAGGPRVRRDFPETLYVNPAIITGADGKATVEVPLADSITEWRVSTLANANDGRLGGSQHGIKVFQDFFVDINFPAELTRGDQVSFPIALYNYLDVAQDVSVTLEAGSWYTAMGQTSATVSLAAGEVKGVSFPVKVNDVGVHTLTVKAIGAKRSDAVERTVRVVADGQAFPTALSGSAGTGSTNLNVSYPANAVPGSGELSLSIYPAFLSSVVSGMDSMLQVPSGCFEQTSSTTWPNVLVERYLRDTKQLTPEIQLKAESYISAGYQRLLTFEHPEGGFSWFGTQDPKPFLSVTAFGVMEFADMNAVHEIDPAMLQRTIAWLAAQQKPDGSWEGDQTEFFSVNANLLRNTAFVIWSLRNAGYTGSEIDRGISYLAAHYADQKSDGYTLGMVANALAVTGKDSDTLDKVMKLLDALKKVDGDKISWSTGGTQTDFYCAGDDADVTATALVAYALITRGGSPDLVKGALTYLLGSRDSAGNFGSSQATVWTLRTLILAATKGTEGAIGTLDVSVDGAPFGTVQLTKDQSDVTTTLDLASLATTGDHEVTLSFAGTGKVSYNLISNYHVPWSSVPDEPAGPLSVDISYDRTSLSVNDTVSETVNVHNLTDGSVYMTLVDVGVPPGFAVETDDLDAYVAAGKLSRYEVTGRQLILYVTEIATGSTASFVYRLRATMPVKASDGGASVYPYYEPKKLSHAAATTLEAI